MAAVKVPRLTEEATTQYQRIARFSIRSHIVYVQAWWDPAKQWTPMRYKVTDAELQELINGWPAKWQEPVSVVEIFIETIADAPEDPVRKDDQQSDDDSSNETLLN